MQIDGVFRYVSPGLQLLFPIFRGTTLKGETTQIWTGTKTVKQLILNNIFPDHSVRFLTDFTINDISSISQDEDLFDTVFRWSKSAKNGIFDEFSQNLRFLKIGEYH